MSYKPGFFIALSCLLLTNVISFSQESNYSKIAKLLLELESNTQWEAVTEAWKTNRSSWVTSLQKIPPPVAEGLLQFENNLKATAVEAAWAGRKAAWRKSCSEAIQRPNLLASLLLELESNMKWESVSDAWAARRESWLAECNKLIADYKAPLPKPAVPVAPQPVGPGSLPAYCTELLKIITEINTQGLKTWAQTKKTAVLWGVNSVPVKEALGMSPSVLFVLAKQNGAKGKTLQTAYDKYLQQLSICLNDWKRTSLTLFTDMVNGNQISWEKDGQRIGLTFILDPDINGEHYLHLDIFGKK